MPCRISLLAVVILGFTVSPAATQEVRPNSEKHVWSKVVFPTVAGEWGVDKQFHPVVRGNDDQSALQFELLIKGPKEEPDSAFDVPDPAECESRLHTADGRVRRSIDDLVVTKEWNQKAGQWHSKATCSFPWTRNEFDEAWIEFRTSDDVYYFELPYGFTRDPRSELCLPSPKGDPEFADSIKPLERGSQVIWWHHVEYDFGEVEPGWQLFL